MPTMESLTEDTDISSFRWARCKEGSYVEILDTDGELLGDGYGSDFTSAFDLAVKRAYSALQGMNDNSNSANEPTLSAYERR